MGGIGLDVCPGQVVGKEPKKKRGDVHDAAVEVGGHVARTASPVAARRGLGAVATAVAILVAPGCTTDAGESMIIVQNQVPDAACVIPSTTSANFRGRGVVEVDSDAGYIFTPLVQSLVAEDETEQSLRVVAVRGADVDVQFPAGFFSPETEAELRDDALTRFSQAFAGSIFPGGTASFGFVVLPPALLDLVAGQLAGGEQVQATIRVVVFGDIDGGEVESVPFSYPVDVCSGCLAVHRGACANLSPEFEPRTGGACNPLQDVPVDCCTDGELELCPAEPPSA